jgi:hypothetical protein
MDSDVVAQFSEITGSKPELATQYLQLTDFNIEQAMQLYFENDGAELTRDPVPLNSVANRASRSTGYEDASGLVHLDSDEEEAQSTPRNRSLNTSTLEDDAAMARRLQEEMYGGQGAADEVRAPMARTTETLVGPEVDFGDDMHESILGQIRTRQRRASEYTPSFIVLDLAANKFALKIDLAFSTREILRQYGPEKRRKSPTAKGWRQQQAAPPRDRAKQN